MSHGFHLVEIAHATLSIFIIKMGLKLHIWNYRHISYESKSGRGSVICCELQHYLPCPLTRTRVHLFMNKHITNRVERLSAASYQDNGTKWNSLWKICATKFAHVFVVIGFVMVMWYILVDWCDRLTYFSVPSMEMRQSHDCPDTGELIPKYMYAEEVSMCCLILKYW